MSALILCLPALLAAAPATRFIVTNDSCAFGVCPATHPGPSPTVDAGFVFGLVILAVDDAGTLDSDYTGTVRITSSDPLAVAPSEHAFTAANEGKVIFEVSLGTLGAQTFTTTDVADGLSGSLSLVVTQTGPCVPTDVTLCLRGGRFRVESEWRQTPGAALAAAHAVSRSDNSGYFWFFGPGNVEVMVKLLDGCVVDGRYWFFASGLTDVGVTLRVNDTPASNVLLYQSAGGQAFVPIQDTGAFTTCP